tara:strand:- start:134 stop:445 length:312 start_codon:yes stop_codon:yes gene_type:complete
MINVPSLLIKQNNHEVKTFKPYKKHMWFGLMNKGRSWRKIPKLGITMEIELITSCWSIMAFVSKIICMILSNLTSGWTLILKKDLLRLKILQHRCQKMTLFNS